MFSLWNLKWCLNLYNFIQIIQFYTNFIQICIILYKLFFLSRGHLWEPISIFNVCIVWEFEMPYEIWSLKPDDLKDFSDLRMHAVYSWNISRSWWVLFESWKTVIKVNITDKYKEWVPGSKYLLSTWCVPDTVLGTRDKKANNCLVNILGKSCISKFNKILIICYM